MLEETPYNWQQADWPDFRYDEASLVDLLLEFEGEAGRLDGLMEGLPEELGLNAALDAMIAEAMQSSRIEGELLEREAVRSSIRNHLGLNAVPEPVKSRMADGAGELMVAVRNGFRDPLSADVLYSWHRMLLGGSPLRQVGAWREGGDPMRVVSGRIDSPRVHFEAPPVRRVPAEMTRFIRWFNETMPGAAAAIPRSPVRSALVHLYFESIHPFEDGNGRIGRALAEKALAQGVGRPLALSLSRMIEADRHGYYDALECAQRGNEVTAWLRWFAGMAVCAQREAQTQVRFLLGNHHFFLNFRGQFNARQDKVLRRMFEAGPEGFSGGMSARKFIALTGASKATATRDLQHLASIGALFPLGEGRAMRYRLANEKMTGTVH